MADVLGLGGQDWSNRLGDAAGEVVFRLAARCRNAVAEGWWRGARRDRALAQFTGAVEVFCYCDPQLAGDRVEARIGHGRHPIHRDVIDPALARPLARLAAEVTPLGLGAALVRVDTGTPGASDRAVATVRASIRLAACPLAWCTWSSTRLTRWPTRRAASSACCRPGEAGR